MVRPGDDRRGVGVAFRLRIQCSASSCANSSGAYNTTPFASPCREIQAQRSVRLGVRTPASHAGNRGSNPLRSATFRRSLPVHFQKCAPGRACGGAWSQRTSASRRPSPVTGNLLHLAGRHDSSVGPSVREPLLRSHSGGNRQGFRRAGLARATGVAKRFNCSKAAISRLARKLRSHKAATKKLNT